MKRAWLAAFAGPLLLSLPVAIQDAKVPAPARAPSCLSCHTGIEEMHPGYPLGCVDCHGGNDQEAAKEKAHVLPSLPKPTDERVLPADYDLPYQRFKNPSNLRVAEQVCGDCHENTVLHLRRSLHGTTAGHLGDGFYEHGLVAGKRPSYSIFPVGDERKELAPHAIRGTTQVPPFRSSGKKDQIATHYSDLPRKACMQCHLWSEGRAIDGRLGLDGDYRGEGCAACHVTYAENGRSQSKDPTIDKNEPGHPLRHRLTSRIPTETCTHCHYGDASIGLHFRGLSQLVPGQPAGPEVPGTTDRLQNGTFYIQDPDLTPPDIHHARGMHCIDCHTLADTMGDGNIYPQMDFAVEIECTSCHGTFEHETEFKTARGRRLTHLARADGAVWLTSKVTGKKHKVTQVKHVLDPAHPAYNARAAAAMDGKHARLECYTCHNGWNVNFYGFHFDRNEQFTQLDLLSGERTPGRVTTQEKVFATFNQLRLGWNHEGMLAPWLVGFSTIGSAHDKSGRTILNQATPETADKLSGVTMIPHQMHTTRPEARGCVECHRAPPTWGLGSLNFRLTREFGYATSQAGLHTIAVDGKTPGRTTPVGTLPLEGDPQALALLLDPVHARATHAYVAGADGQLSVVSLKSPSQPRLVLRKKAFSDPRRLLVQGGHLYAADGVGGLLVFELDNPEAPRLVGSMPSVDARAVALAFPWLLLADGPGGLVVVDVADPARPKALASVDLNGEVSAANEALDVVAFFQYSRTRHRQIGAEGVLTRTRARHLAVVACGLDGVRIVDITQPGEPKLLGDGRGPFRFNRGDVRGVAVGTVFDLGSPGGGLKSQERDYLYVHVDEGAEGNRQQRVRVFDISDPLRPAGTRGDARVYGGTGRLLAFRSYNAPFLQHFVVAAGAGGLGTLVDVSKVPTGAQVAATWGGVNALTDLQFEEFAFDRMQDERGKPWKDVSHEGCRQANRDEILRILRAPIPTEQDDLDRYGRVRRNNPEPRQGGAKR